MDYRELDIHNESDAWNFLKDAMAHASDFATVSEINFEKWPSLHLHLSTGNGSLSTSLMEVFVELQRAIWRSYALLKYQNPKISLLTDEERAELQFDVIIRQGSTDAQANLSKIAHVFLREAAKKMSGAQLVTVVLGATVIITGGVVLCSYLEKRVDIRKAELISQERQELLANQKFMSEQETSRMRILQEAFGRSEALRNVDALMAVPREKFLRNAPRDAEIVFQGVKISGCVANELAKNPRKDGQIIEMRGIFKIIEVDSRKDEGFRVRIRHSTTGEEFSAVLNDIPENGECKKRVGSAQLDRLPINLHIEARRRAGKIVVANIISADEPQSGWKPKVVQGTR